MEKSKDNPIIPTQDTTDVKLPTLQHGDKGEFVAVLQSMLLDRGYSLGKNFIDYHEGYFDNGTRKAVLCFQRDWGIKEDGIVNKETWKYLESSVGRNPTYTVTIKGLSKEMTSDLIKKYVCNVTQDET